MAAIGGHYYSAEETPIERLAEDIGNIDLVYALITGRYPVEAYRDLLLGPAPGIKNVLTFA